VAPAKKTVTTELPVLTEDIANDDSLRWNPHSDKSLNPEGAKLSITGQLLGYAKILRPVDGKDKEFPMVVVLTDEGIKTTFPTDVLLKELVRGKPQRGERITITYNGKSLKRSAKNKPADELLATDHVHVFRCTYPDRAPVPIEVSLDEMTELLNSGRF